MKDPLEIFNEWYQEELDLSEADLPAACCFTTISKDGYPNSRFVSLKEVKDNSFIITGSLQSKKGEDLENNPKVSIAFWWTETKRQIRVQGIAKHISQSESEGYFSNRSSASKIVSTVFHQSKEIENYERVMRHFEEGKRLYQGQYISKPKHWYGLAIKPVSLEFMEFKNTRLHKRMLYTQKDSVWKHTYLQP